MDADTLLFLNEQPSALRAVYEPLAAALPGAEERMNCKKHVSG